MQSIKPMPKAIRSFTFEETRTLISKDSIADEDLERLRDAFSRWNVDSIFQALTYIPKDKIRIRGLVFTAIRSLIAIRSGSSQSHQELAYHVSTYQALLIGLSGSTRIISNNQDPALPLQSNQPFSIKNSLQTWNDSSGLVGAHKKVLYKYRHLFFHREFYVSSNPDLRNIADPEDHYFNCGFQEYLDGLRPNAISGLTPSYSSIARNGSDDWMAYMAEASAIFSGTRKLPTFSIIIPTYNPRRDLLEKCLNSVFNQSYPLFEVILVDDCSENSVPAKLAKEFSRLGRLAYSRMATNSHITKATNHGLSLSSGDYICFVDHDDEISIDALTMLAAHIIDSPGVDFLYSDEGKINERDEVFGLFRKPIFSPCYLLTCGYTAHLSVYRRDFLIAADCLRLGYDGAQDYVQALSMLEHNSKIVHIPWCLYFWREHSQSTAMPSSEAKPYAFIAAQRGLASTLSKVSLVDDVLICSHPFIKGHTSIFPVIGNRHAVSIVVPTANKSICINDGLSICLLDNLVNSIERFIPSNPLVDVQLVVVHNGDLRESQIQSLNARPWVSLVLYDKPTFNLAEKMNLGASCSDANYILFMNDDTQVITPDWLTLLLGYLRLPGVGCVGPKLLFADGSIQHIGVNCVGLPGHLDIGKFSFYPGSAGRNLSVREVTAVTGACVMLRKDLFQSAGSFPLEFPLNYNDVVLCNRIRQMGLSSLLVPYVHLFHFESVSKDGAGSVFPDEIASFESIVSANLRTELFSR